MSRLFSGPSEQDKCVGGGVTCSTYNIVCFIGVRGCRAACLPHNRPVGRPAEGVKNQNLSNRVTL